MAAPLEAMREVPLFHELDDAELEQVARLFKQRTFAPQETVAKEGSGGAAFYLIESGTATVTVGGQERSSLGPGDYFGEIALIDEGTRSATITAATDVIAYGMTSWEFKPFVEDHPQVAWALLKTLAQRLRAAQAQD